MRTVAALAILWTLSACGGGAAQGRATASPRPAAFPWDTMGVLAQSIPCDTPVVVHASRDRAGVAAEYAFLRRHYPGYRSERQAEGSHEGTPVDVIGIIMPNGTQYHVCFDISRFYGHL